MFKNYKTSVSIPHKNLKCTITANNDYYYSPFKIKFREYPSVRALSLDIAYREMRTERSGTRDIPQFDALC